MNNLFFEENRNKTINKMAEDSCLIMFSGSPPVSTRDQHYEFQPDRNFYYLTGIARSNMILFICKHSGISDVTLFIPGDNDHGAGLTDFPLSEDDAKEISAIENIEYTDIFNSKLSRHIARMPCERVYFDFTRLTVNATQTPLEKYAKEFKEKYPGLDVQDIHKTICNFRIYKSQYEIDEIKKAIEITKSGIISMMENCRPFINEGDLEAEFMYNLYKSGHRIPAFSNIIASGRNALIGHYSANNKKIEDDVFVLVDVGAQSNWYCSDVSRVFPSNGKFNDRQTELYNICYDAMEKMVLYIKPGVTMKQTIEYGNSLITHELNKIGISEENTKDLYIFCGYNHYLGLDTHDVGDINIPLAPNMIVAVDSAMGIPEEEINFRIEDDLLITETGCEILTAGIPKTIEDIEMVFQNKKNQ